eukprot:g12641.t1
MPGRKLPDNWDEDTRFDGPEHWGMDERWKGLFPKRGIRADDDVDDSSGSDSDSNSRRGSGSFKGSHGDRIIRAEDTVDISKDDDDREDEDDDDDFDPLGSQGDGHDGFDATSLRIGEAGSRMNIPDTAPAQLYDKRDQSSRPSNSTSVRCGSGSSSRRVRREEAEATVRRWRHGVKDTEPAASCSSRVERGRRVRPRSESGTPLDVSREDFDSASSEGEEEFDESEASITGHERSPALTKTKRTTPTPTPTPRRKGRKGRKVRKEAKSGDLCIGDSPASTERSGRSINSNEKEKEKEKGPKRAGKGEEGGRASWPLPCDDSSSYSDDSHSHSGSSDGSLRLLARGGEGHDEDGNDGIDDGIESIRSDSDSEYDGGYSSNDITYAASAAGGGNEGYKYRSGRNGGSSGRKHGGIQQSTRRSLSSPSPSHQSKNKIKSAGRKDKRHAQTKGSVRREGGRRDSLGRLRGTESHRSSSSSKQNKGSKASSSTQAASGERHAEGGASKRPTQPGGKKLRKVVPAKGDEHGWISKGGGGSGGGGGGGGRGRRDPVSSFQPSQAAVRKNQERSLTQSKINFPVVLDD